MFDQEKELLFAGMDERRNKNYERIKDIPLDAIVHPDTGWRVQDLLGHIAYWDHIAINSIKAQLKGEKYQLDFTGGIDAFNDRDYQKHTHKSGEEMVQMWQDARAELKATLADIPDDQWQVAFKTGFSRGEAITPTQIAKGMGLHEGSHIKEILALKDETTS